MAMRENTGLQISLIIFVMITVLLAAFTWYFFDQDHTHKKLAEDKASQLSIKDAENMAISDELSELKEIVGYKGTDIKDIRTNFKSDLSSAGFSAQTSNYAEALKQVNGKIQGLSKQIVAEKTRADLAESELGKARTLAKAEIDKYLKLQQEAAAALAKASTDYADQRGQLVTKVDGIQQDYEKSSQAVSKITADKDKEIDALMQRISALDLRGKTLREKVEAIQSKSGGTSTEKPDGKITWVSQRGGSVYVNLGSEDGLARGTMFTVYDADTVNIGNTEPKASIEITTIRGPNLAEGRIIEDTLSNPILSQDVVYSPVWNPGQKTHFALVGLMDIDGDKKSDRRLIRGLIEQNGGTIDAEVLDDGSREGKLSINTRYLVQGAQATDKSSAEEIQASSRMIQEASELGIETISVERLLSDMGWRGSERTLGTGSDPSGGAFQPKPKEETDLGPKSQFNQRTRPGSNTRRGSAY